MANYCATCGAPLDLRTGWCLNCDTRQSAYGGSDRAVTGAAGLGTAANVSTAGMSPLQLMLLPWKRYADFRGRSTRSEYWRFALGYFGVLVLMLLFGGGLGAATSALGASDDTAASAGVGLATILLILFWLAGFIPSLAVAVRRLHDQDKSGWLYLITLIPYLGGLVIFIFMLLPGTPGPNRYGADPRQGNVADIFS